ncbi:MAG: GFA family protein [Gammaproteobacteria bacterium]|nr:MAG: GFA family protein [Gammaproteobacteria bacterium]
MKIDGRCHCGFITYKAVIDPDKVLVCHCTDCQSLSGSAFRTVVFADRDTFTLLTGELKMYVKLADSGAERAQMFCPECGTHIYATSVGEGSTTFGVRVGTIHQRRELRPSDQYWCRSALDWVKELGSVKEID